MIRLKNLLGQSSIFSPPLLVGVCAYVFSTSVFANPVLDLNNAPTGQVTIHQEPNSTVINQSSQQAIINWQSFNIGAQESTHFQQPAGGVALNRINPSQGVSEIYGRLTATGQIILVNPAGIFFGPGSYVNVGGLIASTANISNEDFLNNYYHFANDGAYNGAIVNQGQIYAAEHGLVALVGGAVSNEGYIQANMGHAVLASGNSFTMSFAGNDLIGFSVDSGIAQRAHDKNGNESSVGVSNTGSIIANGGRILISAKDAAGVLDKVINMQGIAQTLSVSDGANKHDGEIILIGDEQRGTVQISGKLIASGNSADNKGGNVTVTGHNILLTSSADIDVSGNAGGGNIHIGGNYQGQGPLPNARAVVMLAHAKINADANSEGDGGHVIIWSDDYTNVNGSISARGGSVNGNGGFIETSSKAILNIGDLTVNTNAANGLTGTWLLDPYDVFITSSADSGGSFDGGNPNIFTPSATANILNTTLNTNLNNANVTITTTGAGGDAGNISVNAPITWSSANTLLLQATNNIYLNADITALSGGLSLSAVNSSQSITSGTPGSPSATGVTANINVGNFNLLQGQWYQVNSTLPTFNVTNSFTLMNDAVFNASNPAFYATDLFLRVKGGDGTTGNPYQLADIYGLQGLNSGAPGEMMYANFILANDIDATGTRTWNNGAGFHPIGSFYVWNASYSYNGVFDGNYHTIDGLHINRAQDDSTAKMGAALFGSTWAPTIRNLGLTNVDITSQNNRAAGLVAFASWQSYWTSPRASFTNIYVTGNVTSGAGFAGGIVGYLGDGTISNSYNAATVTGYGSGSAVGGVVGYVANGNIYGQVSNVYNIGTVRNLGTGNAGGIAGVMQSGTTELSYSYNSGSVLTANGIAGGLVAENYGTNVAGNFWDTDTSGTTLSVATGSSVGTGGCFSGTCTNGGTANLSSALTYSNAGWSIASTGFTGTTPPALVNWLILDTQTRPMLRSEWHPSIKTAHQLQLMSTALGESYELANDIDLASALTNASDVWGTNYNTPSGAGFVPIGTSTTQFTGNFDGLNNTINHLYINRPTTDYVGLFGTVHLGTATNFTLSNPTVTGKNYVGGAVGEISFQGSAYIQNVHVSGGSVSGVNIVGGLLGAATGSGVFNSSSSANVYGTAIGSSQIGGLVGNVNSGFSAVIQNSFSTGNVYAQANSSSIGGLVGLYWSEPLSNSYSTGNVVSGNNSSLVGGLIGWGLMSATNAYSTGSVTVGTGSSGIGGLFGAQQAGLISSSYSSGAVTAGTGSSDVGGLVGRSASDAAFSNNYSVSSVTAPNSSVVGGFMGRNDGAPISNSYSSGYINAPGSSNVGGLMGVLTGNLSNSFWDVDTSGYANPFGTNSGTATNIYGGCFTGTCANTGSVNASYLFGGTTAANFSSVATYTTTLAGEGGSAWDITNAPSTSSTPPANVWFIFEGGTRPILMMENTPNVVNGHNLQMMGAAVNGNYTQQRNINLTPYMTNTSDIWGTNSLTATGQGFVPVGQYTGVPGGQYFTGTYDGNGYAINNLYINYKSSNLYFVGLFGALNTNAIISNAQLNNVNITSSSSTANNGSTGGLVGLAVGTAKINTSYTSGSVTGLNKVGGLLGATYFNNGNVAAIEISDSYSTANAKTAMAIGGTSTPIAGGLLGEMNSGPIGPIKITNSYSTGTVEGYIRGGLIGSDNAAGEIITNSYWDTTTSGVATSGGGTGLSTSALMQATTFSGNGWNITNDPTQSAGKTWFIFEGSTRPMLMIENSSSISNTHQLQMMGAALGGDYKLANNIDFTSITQNSDVWNMDFSAYSGVNPLIVPSTSGFIPIGSSSQPFTGNFDGQSYSINRIYTYKPIEDSVGLFSETGSSATIRNINLTDPLIWGNLHVGGITGINRGTIDNAHVTTTFVPATGVGGYPWVGNVTIVGSSVAGGISGTNNGIISNSQSSANVTAGNGTLGGITGVNNNLITDSFSTGWIAPIGGSVAGGLAARNNVSGSIIRSFNSGNIYAGYYSVFFGGLVAYNEGMISKSYNTGGVSTGFANTGTGGLVAYNSPTGVISDSYNTGYTAYGQGTNGGSGSFVGINDGTISRSYTFGVSFYQYNPTSTENNGFVGVNNGTINDSYFDVANTGYTRGYGSNTGVINGLYAGCLGGTSCNPDAITNATNQSAAPVDLSSASTYANWDMVNIWNIIEGQSYPYLRDFYSSTPRAISGIHPTNSRFNSVSIAVNGSVMDSTLTQYNGTFYFLEGYNNVSKIDNRIADLSGIVAYSTTGVYSNYVTYAPLNGASISVTNPVVLSANTITASTSETNTGLITPLSNTQIAGAINGLSSPYLLLSNSGNDVSIANGYNFTIPNSTPYALDGNITLTNGTLTINSPLTITTPNPVLMTNTSGDIILNNTVDGSGNALTINTAGTNSSVSGVMSNLTNVTKTGSGTLIFTGNNNYSGTTTISGGILQIGNNTTTGTLGTGVVNNDAALVFKRSNAVTIGNSVSGTGSLTQAGSNTLTLSGTNTYTGLTYVDSGRLNVSNSLGFGDGINNTAGVIVANGGQLELLNINLAYHPTLTLNGAGSDGKGSLYHIVGNTVFAGNILLGSDATIGNEVASLSLTGDIDNGGHMLTLDASVGIGISGDISGSGGLIITDAPFDPVVSLSGNNTFTGSTTVLRGILNLMSPGALGDGVNNNTSSVTVADGAELNIQDINLLAAPTLTLNGTGLFNGGALYAAAGTGTATYNGVINLGSNASIAVSPGATLVLGNTGSMTGSGFNLTIVGDGNTTIASSIDTGTGALIKNGNGSLILTGDNTYSGGTTINSGILQVGDGVGGSTGLIGTGNITNNASLIFSVNNSVYVNGNISGTGSLTNTDSYLILTGSNNYSGTTTINSGTLQIGDQGTSGTLGTGDVLNNDELMFSRTDTHTVDNLIDGSGYITMNGANGTLVLNNANSFAGGTSINNLATIRIGNNDALGSGGVFVAQGTLQAGVDGLSISNPITVFNETTINNNGYTFTLNGEITGNKVSDILYLNGAGTTILNTNITGPFRVEALIATTDLILNGNILTNGNQSYANDVTLTGSAIFDTEGSGTQNITFNGNILGGQDITLQGSGSGTYHFTINGINANNVNVIAAPGSTNNTLTLNSGGAQNFVLTGSNIGSINGIATVANFNFDNIQNLDGGSGGLNSITAANTPNIWNINTNNGGGVTNLDGSFANMQDLIGGTDSDIFNFTDGVSISGTVDGGDQIDDNNHFDFSAVPDSLVLTLNMPILGVIDAGEVRTSSSALIVSFLQIQRAYGNGSGYITLPNEPSIKLAKDSNPLYANNPKYGAIADPFYFSNWNIGNPPLAPTSTPTTPSSTPVNSLNTPIANIVNQPVYNAVGNNNYSPPNTYGYLYDPTVINRTYIEPLLNTTVLKTGSTCYTTSR